MAAKCPFCIIQRARLRKPWKSTYFPKAADTGILVDMYAFQHMGVGVQTQVIRVGGKRVTC